MTSTINHFDDCSLKIADSLAL